MTGHDQPEEEAPYSAGGRLRDYDELMAGLERHRAEHGPFLRELRCPAMVRIYLAALLPRVEQAPRYAAVTQIPIIEDNAIAPGTLRFVYDDGHHEDHQVTTPPPPKPPTFYDVFPYRVSPDATKRPPLNPPST